MNNDKMQEFEAWFSDESVFSEEMHFDMTEDGMDKLIRHVASTAWQAAQASITTPRSQMVPEEMPKLCGGIYHHEKLGELYDRLQVHQYAVKHCETLAAMLSAATGGQESEAQAVSEELLTEYGAYANSLKINTVDAYRLLAWITARNAPPSALAIESAAKLQAAEVCRKWIRRETIEQCCDHAQHAALIDVEQKILATIPQDGITALEEFGMKVAEAVSGAILRSADPNIDCRAIVKSLIGEKK